MKASNTLRALAFLVLTGAACSSILGIEDIHEGEKPGGGDEGGETGNGGTAGNRGGSSGASGTSGSSGDAGSSGTSTTGGASGSSTGGASGDAGSGGEGDPGGSDTGGSAGSGGTPDDTVRGRVIDFWGHVVPNVPVEIGTQVVVTDTSGEFTIENVAPQYDVELVVQWTEPRAEIYGWRFEGLTRRDPTLQVYSGLPERSGMVTFTPQNATLTDTRRLNVVFGGPDGMPFFTDVGVNGSSTSFDWRGPGITQVIMRGLVYSFDATTDLPTGYHAYAAAPAALSETVAADLSLSLPDDPNIQTGNLTGTVSSIVTEYRENGVFVRFANEDGSTGTIRLVSDYPGPDNFSYLVPNLPQGSVFVTASSGLYGGGPYAVAYKDNAAPGQAISLSVPAAPNLLEPAPGATGADSTTVFRWTTSQTVPGPYVLFFIDQDFYEGAFVVTANTETPLPSFPGFQLRPGGEQHWRVETHGEFDGVDAMAGPDGYLRSVIDDGLPRGPRRGDGVYTISTWYQVFIAD